MEREHTASASGAPLESSERARMLLALLMTLVFVARARERAAADRLAFLTLQFAALREETLRRSDQQQQLVLAALTSAIASLTVGALLRLEWVPLLYLPASCALAAVWANHATEIRRIGRFIGERIEASFLVAGSPDGWEGDRGATRGEPPAHRAPNQRQLRLGVSGVFLATQLIALAAAMALRPAGRPDIIESLVVAQGVASIGGTLMFLHRGEEYVAVGVEYLRALWRALAG